MTNAERFLSAFNELDAYFRKVVNSRYHRSFFQKIAWMKEMKEYRYIRKFEDDLRQFSELRNAIVHESRGNYVIAEPHIETVEHIETIKDKIVSPPGVLKAFGKKVYCLNANDKLSKALRYLSEHKISQLPVLEDGKITDVLNAQAIAYWLAHNNMVCPGETEVQSVLKHKEFRDNYAVMEEKRNVFYAAHLFEESYGKKPYGSYLECIILTKDGSSGSPISGIIVLADIADYI